MQTEGTEWLQSIVEYAGIGIAVLDMNGRTVECNHTLSSFLGYERNELLQIFVADLTHPDDLASDYDLFWELVQQRRKTYQIEKRYFHKDGHIVWGRLTVSLMYDEKGAPRNAISIVEDITERKQLEMQLINSEKFAAVGKLAAGFAHEIRNPLTCIIGFFKLMRRSKSMQEAEKYFDLMEKELYTINDLVSDFVLMAKPSAPDRKPCDIKGLMEDTITLLKSQAIMEKNTTITCSHGSNGEIRANVDPMQMKQVLINLIQNALDAITSGGLIHIHTKLQEEANTLSIAVEDNGVGIPEENLNQIMNPFFTTKDHGVGLGLSVCYRIIENHGGSIAVFSQEGVGTKFEVLIPIT